MIGAWKSFDELEDSITLDELFDIYGATVDKENQDLKRSAAIQGIDIPDEEPEKHEETLFERMARQRSEETGDMRHYAEAKFGEGQGYEIIGG